MPWLRVWIDLRAPARLWVASLGFTVVGASLVWALPRGAPALMTDPLGAVVMGCLGWVLLGSGLPALVALVITLTFHDPERAATWHWWINFLGGLAGALVFAVPATLLLPLMLGAYWGRPNPLFPAESAPRGQEPGARGALHRGWVRELVATWWLALLKLQESPKRGV